MPEKPVADDRPTPGTQRTRRWRSRQHDKRLVVQIELGPRDVALLMAHRLVRIADRNDRVQLGAAVMRHLRGEV